MLSANIDHHIYQLFADILDYPWEDTSNLVLKCTTTVSMISSEAAVLLESFHAQIDQTPQGHLQEVYASTFELQTTCCPYIGYHLFGDSYNRAQFLVGLKERYKAHGFTSNNELPDHMVVILRFLAVVNDEDLRKELIDECLIPTLDKISQTLGSEGNPYKKLIEALLIVLRDEHEERPAGQMKSMQED